MINLTRARAVPGPWDLTTPPRYSVIYADPPWSYGDQCLHRGGAERHYPTLSPEDLRRLPVRRISRPDSLCFMWVTGPQMDVGLSVLRAWGFAFKTTAFTWIKRHDSGKLAWGMGGWTRANPEFVLLGVRGKLHRQSAGVHSVIEAVRRAHSTKPPEVRDRIVDLVGDVPRIELFARARAPGWDAWGNQLPSQTQTGEGAA